MKQFGYTLACEEHEPRALVEYAVAAEQAGFDFAMASDHFHPWIGRQGQSPNVWPVLGAVAMATKQLRLGTGVTCPTHRLHPAIVAQAAATVSAMMPGRFFLGVGTGENLNEHVTGGRWPSAPVRRKMLEEAVAVMRELWRGDLVDFRGEYFTVEGARLYTRPDEAIPVYVAASGQAAAALGGRIGDGLISTAPKPELVHEFDMKGPRGRPHYAQITVCYAPDEAQARRTAREVWPNSALPGDLSAELPLPRHFEQASQLVTEDKVAEMIVCGPDPERHVAMIRKYEHAGFDHLFFHQVGPDQQGFMRFYAEQVLPHARESAAQRRRGAA